MEETYIRMKIIKDQLPLKILLKQVLLTLNIIKNIPIIASAFENVYVPNLKAPSLYFIGTFFRK